MKGVTRCLAKVMTDGYQCVACQKIIDRCCLCEEESYECAVCYLCLVTSVGESRPQPHDHGG